MRNKRNDLLKQTIAMPEGYIGGIVSPAYVVFAKEGKILKIVPSSAANLVEGRTPGAVVTPTVNNAIPVLYACSETSDRQLVDDGERRQYGDDLYKLNLAAAAFTNVADKAEQATSAALFAVAAAVLTGSSDYEKILAAVDALKGKRGKLALVGSSSKLRGLRLDDDVKDALKNTGTIPATQDPRFASNVALAACCNVSVVLEGLDVLWPANALAVMVLADKAFAPKQLIQSMRSVVYAPDNTNPGELIECYEGYDDTRKSEYVDVEEWVTPLVLNDSLIQIIDGSTESGSSGA